MLKKTAVEIEFDNIGKTSKAHLRAKLVTDKKKKPDKILKLEELLAQIKMTEVGKRLKNA